MIIPVFMPHGGCPERCSFCDQRVSGGEPTSPAAIAAVIEQSLATSTVGTPVEVAFYGGTFTALAPARQLACLEAVRPYLEDGRVGAVRIATRPDALERSWLERLRDDYAVRVIELGAQSFNNAVLASLGRSHTPTDTARGVGLIKELGLEAGLHLMIGCPGETDTDDELTIEQVSALAPALVRIHPLLVLKGTRLEAELARGAFRPLELESAVARAARLTRSFEAQGIKVIRLGLQQNELLGEAIVAGPYHPGFGDLVRGRLARDRAAALLERERGAWERAGAACEGGPAGSGVVAQIRLSERISGSFRGPGGANLTWLKGRFDLSSIELAVLQGSPHDDVLEVRLYHAPGASQRGQIESAQLSGGERAGHRHAQGSDDAAGAARLSGAP